MKDRIGLNSERRIELVSSCSAYDYGRRKMLTKFTKHTLRQLNCRLAQHPKPTNCSKDTILAAGRGQDSEKMPQIHLWL